LFHLLVANQTRWDLAILEDRSHPSLNKFLRLAMSLRDLSMILE
jgi:hypothetical protein